MEEKLIYIHVLCFGDSLEEDRIEGHRDATNDWYVIKARSGGGGVEMSRAFEDAGQLNHPNPALRRTRCEVIGSCIYVIGGSCLLCRADSWCDYYGSGEIRCLDTRNPKDGWKTCFTLPFSGYIGSSGVVDDRWLYIFPGNTQGHGPDPEYPCFACNVDDGKTVREIAQPGDGIYTPSFSTCLYPGSLVFYMLGERAYQLDCHESNSSWSVYQNDSPYSKEIFARSPTAVYDGILYIYESSDMKLISYDLRNKKELYAVDLPKTKCFGLYGPVDLLVLSKDRFCLMWEEEEGVREMLISYTRFSVSGNSPNPTVSLEETRDFTVAGCRVINILTADPNIDAANNTAPA